jgi:transposase
MDHFIGLDAHKNSCMFVAQDQKGKIKRKAVIETQDQALIRFTKTIPGRRHLCTEEGTHSQWLFEILHSHVHDMAIVQGRKQRGNKDDFRDALDLANRMRTGDLGPRIFKVPEELIALKDMVRSYEMINADLTRVKNRIKHAYRSRGAPYSKEGCPFCTESSDCTKPGCHQLLKLLRQQQEHLESLKGQAQKTMITEANRHAITRILKTAPGFGPVRSAQLLSIMISPYRFRTSRQLWQYSGLGIVMRSSSDYVQLPNSQWIKAPVYQTRGLNRNFNRTAKAIFKGAAITVITSMAKDPLRRDYERLLENGTKPTLARLTLARKIAAIVLAMWKNKEVYDPETYRVTDK